MVAGAAGHEPAMSEPTFRAIPVLRIFDLAKAKEFYLDFLGFRLEWEHRPAAFMEQPLRLTIGQHEGEDRRPRRYGLARRE